MKKTALTIGLFSLVMVLTSFASPEVVTSTTPIMDAGINEGYTVVTRKLDVEKVGSKSTEVALKSLIAIEDNGGGSTGGGRKLD
ncbi:MULTISPECIES: hypothetical protein [Flavobacterium]|uniref:Uncharacterized protein n=2 Tax=Flavobacterium TaxID=237 RepID=A0A941AXF9_9FLAO|nr:MULTISPECIES: hypothetical protein [Flavobacterium]MBP4138056.1 hypothetical protein [Flavobacterium geliluteum]MDX6180798.1 hypothetical protein [Flavobacterium sp. Fl-33]MDX6184398.1 hypothetical protein [Flavobacterium sp. Fl-77]UFH39507.1 hypothetical protein LNP22_04330 [Flavobacterium sp. F-70]